VADNAAEGDQAFELVVTGGGGASIIDSTGTATVIDDD